MLDPRLAAGWLWRLPHQAWALAVCALALLFGVAIADDYGIWVDTYQQRAIGEAALRHLAGENGFNLLWPPSDRLYGPVLEAPLRLIERFFGPDDSRSLYLTRRLLTHLFFLGAGFVGYLLAYRLFGSRWLALFALALFLLHPRIYAHSFFNSKDVPFLGMFMICLWLAHRAFGASRSSGVAFLLCGVAAGVLTNLRIAGLAFFAIVTFMRFCDVVAAGGWSERRRVVTSWALFAFASIATYYATMPYLWADPLERFREVLAVMLAHPVGPLQLFQGEFVGGAEIPPGYLPAWFGVTTPPLALLLGAVGFVALVWRIARHPLEGLLRNTPLRFELLLAACFVLPVLAALVLGPTLHSDWRHFYFLWAPFALLATSGLKILVESTRRRLATRLATAFAAGVAALGLGAMAVEIARLHPHQNLYFNVLANRFDSAAPLRERFHLDDTFSPLYGYAHVLYELDDELGNELGDEQETRHAVFNVWLPASARRAPQMARLDIAVSPAHLELFRQRDRRRLRFDPKADPDFYVRDWRAIGRPSAHFAPLLYERRLYDEPIVQVATPDLSRVDETTANAYRALFREVTSGTPALRGDIDVYRDEAAIAWVKARCAAGDLHQTMEMTVIPLPAGRSRQTLYADGVRVDDACLWRATLPDYAIARIIFPGIGTLASDAHLEERRRHYAALAATPPAARSTFDVYLQDGTLVYVKTPCVQADTEAPFFVHVRAKHLGDLPRSRRRHGFEALDFRFSGVNPHWRETSGDIFDGTCMATLELPAYPITGVATGQYTAGGASLWRVDVDGG